MAIAFYMLQIDQIGVVYPHHGVVAEQLFIVFEIFRAGDLLLAGWV